MLESLVNKVAGQHRCFPVNIEKFLRAPILKNICQRLPLVVYFSTTMLGEEGVCIKRFPTRIVDQ